MEVNAAAAEAPRPMVQREPMWPVVLGALGAAWSVLGAMAGCFGLLTPALVSIAGTADPQMTASVRQAGTWIVVAGVAGLLVNGALLAGSILLIRRRPAARRWLLAWAVADTALLAFAIGLAMLMAPPLSGGSSLAAGPGMVLLSAGGCLSVFTILVPAGAMVWLMRPAVKMQMLGWRG